MVSAVLLLASIQTPEKLPGLVTDPWLQLTESSTGMVVEFITHMNPRITIEADGLYVKKIENMALKTDDLELQKFVVGNLKPNQTFEYSLVEDGQKVTYTGHAPATTTGVARVAIFGDSGTGSADQAALAKQIGTYDPMLIVNTGDVVKPYGQEPDYLSKYFAVYSDTLSRTPVAAAAGECEGVYRDYEQYPAGLCYYKFFNLPKISYPWTQYFGNYSFTYGNAYWIVLDSNTYNDWSDSKAQAWIKAELTKGAKYTWRFVTFHHSPWSSSTAEPADTHMRVLDPLWKAGKVQIVFTGHLHDYERAKPDLNGPIYIVSGAGDGGAYTSGIPADKTQWQPYTQIAVSGPSYTQFVYDAKSAVLTQVGKDGATLDAVRLNAPVPVKATKPAPKRPASKKKKGGG
ncbi:MAG: metallophosphoesterase [Armatimonadetes bacterium]|nr:metallophosphoesterase [Armatimonadota bacterium]